MPRPSGCSAPGQQQRDLIPTPAARPRPATPRSLGNRSARPHLQAIRLDCLEGVTALPGLARPACWTGRDAAVRRHLQLHFSAEQRAGLHNTPAQGRGSPGTRPGRGPGGPARREPCARNKGGSGFSPRTINACAMERDRRYAFVGVPHAYPPLLHRDISGRRARSRPPLCGRPPPLGCDPAYQKIGDNRALSRQAFESM